MVHFEVLIQSEVVACMPREIQVMRIQGSARCILAHGAEETIDDEL
jgi:hypothetical protein